MSTSASTEIFSTGRLVHVTTRNGGECDYVLAWAWNGPSYALCVESGYPAGYAEVIWIESERIASVVAVPTLADVEAGLARILWTGQIAWGPAPTWDCSNCGAEGNSVQHARCYACGEHHDPA